MKPTAIISFSFFSFVLWPIHKIVLYWEAEKTPDFDMIEKMLLCDGVGQILEEWTAIPNRFLIDVRSYYGCSRELH
ncbi:MAG: hypothetical protein EAY81_09225 [Bacteroidetes bacterium]|nr:MAG: hypothetical protein EAY81_09225 [Bacteroidota bacterium]